MIAFFIVISYVFIFTLLIKRVSYFYLNGLGKNELVVLFLVKVIAAFAYIFIAQNFVKSGDIFSYYEDSGIIFNELKNGHVFNFMQLTFGCNNTIISSNIAQCVEEMGFWFDPSAYMIVRFNSIVNLFTLHQGLYTNAVFFAFLSFLASFLLARLFVNLFGTSSRLVFAVVFLMPSVLFWTSGMHKESLSVLLVAIIMSTFFQIVHYKKWVFLPLLLVAALLLFYTRYFILLMLLPSMSAYLFWFYSKWKNPIFNFALVYTILLLFTYLIPAIFNTPNLVDLVIAKKELYETLDNGNTAINLGVYHRSYLGLLLKIPQALFNSVFRPHLLDANTPFLLVASVESFFITIFSVAALYKFIFLERRQQAICFTFFTFSFSYLLLTGLIVPNLGAILRYRSVALFILMPIVALILSDTGFFFRKK